jgi:hypothetical protein
LSSSLSFVFQISMSEFLPDLIPVEHRHNTVCEECHSEAYKLRSILIEVIQDTQKFYNEYKRTSSSQSLKKSHVYFQLAKTVAAEYIEVVQHKKSIEIYESDIREQIFFYARLCGALLKEFISNDKPTEIRF